MCLYHSFRRALALLLYVLSVCIPVRAAVLCVNAASVGTNHDGSSWITAFPTVAAGLNAAVAGDEVWVAAGKYYENITLKSGVALYGGFLGTEAARFQRNSQSNVTILDGQYKGTVVVIPADATSATVLDGFTIQNGYGPVVNNNGAGGGIYAYGGTPVISNNVITGCIAASGGRTITSTGGGIFVAGGTPLIAGNTIANNYAMFGGGIYATGGLIRDNIIAYNTASHPYLGYGAGGGIEAYGTVIVHNLVRNNNAPDSGGGGGGMDGGANLIVDNVFQDNAGFRAVALRCTINSTVRRNTILDTGGQYPSSYIDFGGGTFSDNLIVLQSFGDGLILGFSSAGNSDGTEPLISNNTFAKTGPQTSTAVWSEYHRGEKPVFSNNTVTGWQYAGRTYGSGTPQPVFTIDHNNSFGNGDNSLSFPGGSPIGVYGNISQDPLFVDPANGDYRLQAGSPCIDAGNDAYVKSGDRDAGGSPRIYGAHVDIGAYEYGSPLYTMLDAAEVLRIASGISIGTPANVSRLDVVPQSSGLTILDATRIAQWLLN